MLVGACHADQLIELATPVYWSGSLDLSVEDERVVWRYMDFAKFVSMVQHQGFFASPASHLGDRFEGAVGLVSREPIGISSTSISIGQRYNFLQRAFRNQSWMMSASLLTQVDCLRT